MNRDWNFLLISLMVLLCFSAPSFSQESPDSKKEVIAILGTGDMGDSFGPRLAELGYEIVYGSRNPNSDKVVALLEKTGNGASATTNDLAARKAEIVFLALPWGPMEQIIKSLGDMEGKTIIDLSWPESEFGEDGYFQITADPSGAEIIQSWIPKASVVKAFGTTATNIIDDPNDAGGPVTIPIASDHRHAKEVRARIAAKRWLITNASVWTPTSRFTSVIHNNHGNGDRMKTPTAYLGSTSRKEWIYQTFIRTD